MKTKDIRVLLDCFSLPVADGGVADDEDDVVNIAREVGFPVALKITSREIIHKSDVGGVRLNLSTEEEVRSAYREMFEDLKAAGQEEQVEGILVQEMVEEGVEIMIGSTHDPQFGHLVGFGLGGVFVEILSDVQFRVTPLTDRDARELIQEIRGTKILEGYRGKPRADMETIEEILLRVSRLVEELPEIQELDLNPIFARPEGEGCTLVDARIRVKNG